MKNAFKPEVLRKVFSKMRGVLAVAACKLHGHGCSLQRSSASASSLRLARENRACNFAERALNCRLDAVRARQAFRPQACQSPDHGQYTETCHSLVLDCRKVQVFLHFV